MTTTAGSLRDRVIELAHNWRSGHYTKGDRADIALAVAAMVAEHERAACALICDEHASIEGIAQRCSDAIRARKGEL